MLGLLLDAAVLMLLLKVVNEDDLGLGTAVLVALAAAVGTWILTYALALAMGTAGIYVGALLAAALLGVAISALFGVEIKRSFLVAGLFMVVHIGVGLAIQAMLH
jgi:hypothetical protein